MIVCEWECESCIKCEGKPKIYLICSEAYRIVRGFDPDRHPVESTLVTFSKFLADPSIFWVGEFDKLSLLGQFRYSEILIFTIFEILQDFFSDNSLITIQKWRFSVFKIAKKVPNGQYEAGSWECSCGGDRILDGDFFFSLILSKSDLVSRRGLSNEIVELKHFCPITVRF